MKFSITAAASVLLAAGQAAHAAPPPAPVHIRGTVQSLKGQVLTVSSASGPVRIILPKPIQVVSVIPSDRAHIKDGSFLGIASVPGASGTQQAREVVVFPESGRGTGEGSYAWDLAGGGQSKMTNGKAMHSRMTNGTAAMHSRMTNGTVSASRMTNGTAVHSRMTNGTVSKGAGSTTLTLQYKSGAGMGAQTLTLPPNIPVVTFAPGQPAEIKPGAHVFVAGVRQPDGSYKSMRLLVGKDGLVPPM